MVFGLLTVTVFVILVTPFALIAVVSVAYIVRNGATVLLDVLCPPNTWLKAIPTVHGNPWTRKNWAWKSNIRLILTT